MTRPEVDEQTDYDDMTQLDILVAMIGGLSYIHSHNLRHSNVCYQVRTCLLLLAQTLLTMARFHGEMLMAFKGSVRTMLLAPALTQILADTLPSATFCLHFSAVTSAWLQFPFKTKNKLNPTGTRTCDRLPWMIPRAIERVNTSSNYNGADDCNKCADSIILQGMNDG